MKRHTVRQRLATFLLAALMSLSWLPPLPAFAEDDAAVTASAAENDLPSHENEATPETSDPESNVMKHPKVTHRSAKLLRNSWILSMLWTGTAF